MKLSLFKVKVEFLPFCAYVLRLAKRILVYYSFVGSIANSSVLASFIAKPFGSYVLTALPVSI